MVELSEGKYERMQRLSDSDGVIKAAAMDQRGSLFSRLSRVMDIPEDEVTYEMISEFKEAVSRELTPHSSAILLDPEWGLEGAAARADDTGLIMSYEKSGSSLRYGDVYTHSLPNKMKELMPDWSVRKSIEEGADAVKLLIYYRPDEDGLYRDAKQAFVERVGAECAHNDIPLFLEFLGYGLEGDDWKNDPDLARIKPKVVRDSMAEFSRDRYNVDVLKVEIPINLKFTKGTDNFSGDTAVYDREEALEHYQEAADAAEKPFIYLSAGVNAPEFRESLRLANEANIDWNGVLCGRATWQEGIQHYAEDGVDAFSDWLADGGVDNIQRMNAIIDDGAEPWYSAYGGRDQIDVT